MPADALTRPLNAVAVPTTKRCGSCRADKPVGDFHRDSRRPDGLRRECKVCNCAASTRSRERRRERGAGTVL